MDQLGRDKAGADLGGTNFVLTLGQITWRTYQPATLLTIQDTFMIEFTVAYLSSSDNL